MKVLITGAAGKIGRLVAADLANDNIDIVGFDAAPRPSGLDCPWFMGDLSDASLNDAMKGCDTVIHLAAIPKHIDGLEVDTCRVNFLGTVKVLDYAVQNKISRVVAASSICASGLITGKGSLRPETLPIAEDFNGGPDDMYGMSKRFGEYLADAYQRRYGLHMINLRVASVAFRNDPDYDAFMSIVFDKKNDDSVYFKDIRWQYVDERDASQAFCLAATYPQATGIYNVGAGDTPGSDWRVWWKESFRDVPEAAVSAGLRDDLGAPLWSVDRISKELGFAPKHTWREHPVLVRGAEDCLARSS